MEKGCPGRRREKAEILFNGIMPFLQAFQRVSASQPSSAEEVFSLFQVPHRYRIELDDTISPK